jgi:prepilin-type N-terminal cleavage/methylation domain-containing protein
MKKNKPHYGFTIVELVLVIALLGIIGTVTGFILKESLKSYTLIIARKDSLVDARRAIERMKSELRIAMNIDSMSATSLQFDTTTENNISYTLNGTDLERNGNDIAQSVSALTLTYLDAGGAGTAVTANVRRVQLDITVSTASHGSLRLRSQVYLRQYYYTNFQ